MNFIDNISYRGEVTLTKKFGNRVNKRTTRNEGLVDLFSLLSKAMAGINTAPLSPAYLAIYNGNDSSAAQIAGPFPLIGTTHSWTDSNHDGQVGVVFQGSIRCEDTPITGASNYLVLVSKSNSKLAQVQFTETLSNTTDEVLVEWILWFGNEPA